MLEEDLHHQHYAYKAGIGYEGIEHTRGDDIISSLLHELDYHRGRDGFRLFTQLVSTVACDHLTHGKCIFELFSEDEGGDSTPRLGILPGWSLRKHWRKTLQVGSNSGKLTWQEIPESALVEFHIPDRLEKALRRTKERLQVIDKYRPGDFNMLTSTSSTGYEFSAHKRTLDEISAQATKEIGWDGRGLFLSRATDSYRTYRRLRFLHTWLTIVSATTSTLNRIFANPTVNGGTPFTVHTTGLPTIEQVEHDMAAVTAGTKPLGDIFNRTLQPRYR
ncbi:hypothetical protein [Prauserella muralis]|uniref:hypothetical protein n=1 Tax=Prauserella muralis TaxID=588067 RepID=UPI0011BE7EEA|nr:hypothetical protein [Prauserella muralis]